MKMNLGAGIDGECAAGVHEGITVDHVGLVIVPGFVAVKEKYRRAVRRWPVKISILAPGHEVYILQVAIGDEQDGVGDDKGCVLVVRIDGDFGKDPQTVVCVDRDVAETFTRYAVDVETKAGSIAAGQPDGGDVDCLVVVVV